MSFAPVLKLLSERAGLDPASLGSTAVKSAVAARLRACHLRPEEYAVRLADDAGEFQALLEEVVVPETWFFRGGVLFFHLAEQVRARRRTSRVLSIPCSTGEEPYSLAVALAELGVPPASCVLDGVDVSARNVEAAQAGVFGELSFRQTDPSLRARYFRPAEGGWQIVEPLRRAVRFLVGNVLDPALLLFEAPYDVVFCRNLFIYLTPPARRQALQALARLLTPGGLLSLGHAEPLDADDARFRRTGPDGMFLYERTAMTAAHPGLPAPVRQAPQPDAPPRRAAEAPRSTGVSPVIAATGGTPVLRQEKSQAAQPDGQPTRDDLLAQARRQADGGQLAPALELCRTIEGRFGPCADTSSLTGIIHQARRDSLAATRAFRRALYLEPNHREALTHLMLLCQDQGDRAQAELLRKRLERLGAAPGGEP
jgi:chemotaxis protein methyltransferase WspC